MKIWKVIIAVCISFCIGYLVSNFTRKPEKITVVTKVEYKDRIVNKDTVIERKIYVATNGTVVTEEKEIIKDRIVEKEVIKEKEVNKTNQVALVSLNIGYNVLLDPNIITSQTPIFHIENWTIGVKIDQFYVNYTHINAHPDMVSVGIVIPIF